MLARAIISKIDYKKSTLTGNKTPIFYIKELIPGTDIPKNSEDCELLLTSAFPTKPYNTKLRVHPLIGQKVLVYYDENFLKYYLIAFLDEEPNLLEENDINPNTFQCVVDSIEPNVFRMDSSGISFDAGLLVNVEFDQIDNIIKFNTLNFKYDSEALKVNSFSVSNNPDNVDTFNRFVFYKKADYTLLNEFDEMSNEYYNDYLFINSENEQYVDKVVVQLGSVIDNEENIKGHIFQFDTRQAIFGKIKDTFTSLKVGYQKDAYILNDTVSIDHSGAIIDFSAKIRGNSDIYSYNIMTGVIKNDNYSELLYKMQLLNGVSKPVTIKGNDHAYEDIVLDFNVKKDDFDIGSIPIKIGNKAVTFAFLGEIGSSYKNGDIFNSLNLYARNSNGKDYVNIIANSTEYSIVQHLIDQSSYKFLFNDKDKSFIEKINFNDSLKVSRSIFMNDKKLGFDVKNGDKDVVKIEITYGNNNVYKIDIEGKTTFELSSDGFKLIYNQDVQLSNKNNKVVIKNNMGSLKDVLENLYKFLSGLKLLHPQGPTTALAPNSAADLKIFENAMNNLLDN